MICEWGVDCEWGVEMVGGIWDIEYNFSVIERRSLEKQFA